MLQDQSTHGERCDSGKKREEERGVSSFHLVFLQSLLARDHGETGRQPGQSRRLKRVREHVKLREGSEDLDNHKLERARCKGIEERQRRHGSKR